MQNSSDLNKFLDQLNIKDALSVEEDLGNGYVRLKISEAERRQALQDINCVEDIIVELLRNSRDAGSKNIFIGTKRLEDKNRIIHFIDDGVGIPPGMGNLIFEARVTSKLDNGKKDSYGFHGRGMALFSIKLNVDDIRLSFSDKSKGASFYLDIDLDKVPEKKDQSLIPQIIKMDDDVNIIGGVNNIIKTIIEFQLQNKDMNFYYGTPTQILATMREILKRDRSKGAYPSFDEWAKLINFINQNDIKVTEIPVLTDNYNLMGEIADKIFNMNISRRGIQRIMYNEVKPLVPLKLDLLNYTIIDERPDEERKENGVPGKNGKRDVRLKLYDESKLASRFKDEEIRCIIDALEENINQLGNKYFVSTGKNIEFKRSNNIIKLIIELTEKE
ncbi:MAG: ATP-binding protein [Actinomycetota bacterium]|nr:MAG: ATP-binding protein [Actinomycetota bacterium]